MFKLWSENNPAVIEQLKPDLWLRSWNNLESDEKYKIWKFLEEYFFNIEQIENTWYKREKEYLFYGNDWYKKELKERIKHSIYFLNEKYKHKSYASKYLKDDTLNNACEDFYDIFNNQDENIVLELLSIYAKILIIWSKKTNGYLNKKEDEKDEDYEIRFNNYQFRYFDKFADRLNEIFWDFWLNILLSRQWFIPKQEDKIIEDIFKPTLEFLSDKKWESVNRDLSDWFNDYNNKDYSWCITKTISAIQWFLQIQVDWTLSNLSIKEWIKKSKEKWLIPNDIFTETIFKNIDGIISRERQETADAHPKREYANENNARLILNLSMVFMQHFIQKAN